MPNYNATITGFAVGDDLLIRRTINRSASNLPTGVVIAQAWLTVKEDEADTDPGLFQKVITTTDVSGTGQIEEDGSASAGDADPILRFDLTTANTRTISNNHRWYDIQVKTDTGAVYTGEKGEIWGIGDVTISDT